MLTQLVVFVRSLALICAGHRAVALENVARRQQVVVFKRASKRPSLRYRDRLFWMAVLRQNQNGRRVLILWPIARQDSAC